MGIILLWQGGKVVKGPIIKQNAVNSSFPAVIYILIDE